MFCISETSLKLYITQMNVILKLFDIELDIKKIYKNFEFLSLNLFNFIKLLIIYKEFKAKISKVLF
jgi:hypothetical protein